MSFPTKRLRRLRISEKMRELVQETTLTPKDFICPVFVQEDLKTRIKVESMSEIERLPLEDVNEEVKTIIDLGIPAIMLFGIPTQKDEAGRFVHEQKQCKREVATVCDLCDGLVIQGSTLAMICFTQHA